MSLAGDVVLISGATSGIGEACAHRFAEAGCKLVVTGRRTARLDALKAALEAKYGVDVKCVTMDVTDLDRVAGLPAELLPLEVDILINNAGLALGVAGADSRDVPRDGVRGARLLSRVAEVLTGGVSRTGGPSASIPGLGLGARAGGRAGFGKVTKVASRTRAGGSGSD